MHPALHRLAAVLACATLIAGCGDDDDGEPAEPAPAVSAAEVLWPDPASALADPLQTARSFVEDYIGVEDPALSAFREHEGGAGKIDVFRRGEDGRALETIASSLSLRQLDGEKWFVVAAVSPDVSLTEPEARAEISSPLRVEGKGRGFEGNVVLELRGEYATEPLAQEPVTAGSGERLEPFGAELEFDPGEAAAGALVAKTGSGIAVADGFAAMPLRFSDG